MRLHIAALKESASKRYFLKEYTQLDSVVVTPENRRVCKRRGAQGGEGAGPDMAQAGLELMAQVVLAFSYLQGMTLNF